MSFFLNGVHLPHRKNTAGFESVELPLPKTVVLPMSMHIGKPARPTVKPGDRVYVGTVVAKADEGLSSPIHSSVSGEVKKIDEILIAGGAKVPAIVIEADGLSEKDPNLAPPEVTNKEEFIAAVKNSGIVGLGGAGFPTYAKLDVKEPDRADTLIINAAECEPYITSDTRTMLERTGDIEEGIALFEKFLGIEKTIIGIEENKKEAIARMRSIAAKNSRVNVKVLPSVYPQGGEKVLVYHTTGKVIPAGKLPLHVGCIVCNCTTLAEIAEYMRTGMPLVKKCVTVDGGAVAAPKNVTAPIGTAISDLLAFCGLREEPKKILFGGPMMGIAVPSADLPIMKNTNAILAFTQKEAARPRSTQCIHCGMCAAHCPVRLAPMNIAKAYKNGNAEMLAKLRVDVCMECGCCSYICPAKRPLVETNKLSKALLREHLAAQKGKEGSK